MKFSALVALATCGSAAAFSSSSPMRSTSKLMSTVDAPVEGEVEAEPAIVINGWTPDSSKFCAGLPGALAPMGDFDPLGLAEGKSVTEIKRFREAEVTHGRVAMMATLGFLVGENFHPLFGGQISGPANSHLQQVEDVAPIFFVLLSLGIGGAELNRALSGWEKPSVAMSALKEQGETGAFGALLRDDYYPGDIGFDPLGLKPSDGAEFAEMQTKELQNGRLAMLAAMGMIVQELVTNEPLLTTLKGFSS